MRKLRVSTAWLCGCSGCHMSLLNLDEALFGIFSKVQVVRSPIIDEKGFKDCDVGIVEGAVADEDNLETLRSLRESCKVLIALGDCAVFGGMTSMRNIWEKEEVLKRAYVETETTTGGKIPVPDGRHLPRLLDQASSIGAYVKVDFYLPGCPPHHESILYLLNALTQQRDIAIPRSLLHYDSRVKARGAKNEV